MALLEEQNAIYDEQSARQVVKMRGWVLVLLSRRALADAALPFVLEELDTALDPYLVGAAAMALRAYPVPRPEFAPFIRRAFENIRGHDQPLSFSAFGGYAQSADAPTALRELLATAGWLGEHGGALTPALLALRDSGTVPTRLRNDLQAALSAIGEQRTTEADSKECCSLRLTFGRSTWSLRERKDSKSIDGTVLQDQTGALSSYGEIFKGAPAIVAFFYTRCDNPVKCSLTIWKLASVQKLLEARGLTGRIRTAAITYDPAYDLPGRLLTFGTNRGLKMDSDNHLLRAVDGIAPLRSHFALGISFAARLVNRHRIEVFLLDPHGRIAASFQRFRWDETEVVDQAAALLADERPMSSRPVLKAVPAAGPLGAVLIACLPKCPLCWSAYLSSAGLTAVAGEVYPRTLQLVSFLLIVNSLSLFLRARATGAWLAFVLSLIGTALIVASVWSNPGARTLGTSLVMTGALLSALGGFSPPGGTRRSRSTAAYDPAATGLAATASAAGGTSNR